MKENMQMSVEYALVLALIAIVFWNVFALINQDTHSLFGVLVDAFNRKPQTEEETAFLSGEISRPPLSTIVVYQTSRESQPEPTPTPEALSP